MLTCLALQLYETESKRRIKKEPAVAFELQQYQWFPSSGTEASGEEEVLEPRTDKLSELWTFS